MQKDLMSCYAGFGDTLYKMSDFAGAYANHSTAFKIFEKVFWHGRSAFIVGEILRADSGRSSGNRQ